MFIGRLLLLMVLLTLILISLGGVVHNTESSLACPDWPLCFGEALPVMEGGVAIEHSHRLLATFIGMLSTLLLILTIRQRKTDSNGAALGWMAFILVVAQGALGGITVIFKLPTLVSTAHLATSMLFFATLVVMWHRQSWTAFAWDASDIAARNKALKSVTVALALVYFQMILGALVRHTGSGAAAGLGPDSIIQGFDLASGQKDFWPSDGPGRLQMLHRFVATAIALHFLVAGHRAFYLCKAVKNSTGAILSLLMVFFLGLQFFLGIASIWTFLSVSMVTAHLACGAILLMTTLLLRLHLAADSPERNS